MSEIRLAFSKENRNVVCFDKKNNPNKTVSGVIYLRLKFD